MNNNFYDYYNKTNCKTYFPQHSIILEVFPVSVQFISSAYTFITVVEEFCYVFFNSITKIPDYFLLIHGSLYFLQNLYNIFSMKLALTLRCLPFKLFRHFDTCFFDIKKKVPFYAKSYSSTAKTGCPQFLFRIPVGALIRGSPLSF